MSHNRHYLNDKRSEDVSLSEKKGLSGIIEGKSVNRGHQLVEILAHCLTYLLVCVVSANMVHAFEHLDHIFRGVQNRRNDEDAK